MIQSSNPTDGELWREAYLAAFRTAVEDAATKKRLTFAETADSYVETYRERFPRTEFTPGDTIKLEEESDAK